MTFRDRFEMALRARKAKSGNWTKAFSWRQVLEVFDEIASDDLPGTPGCVQHGFCPGCVLEELEQRVSLLERKVREDDSRRSEGRDLPGPDPGDPRSPRTG